MTENMEDTRMAERALLDEKLMRASACAQEFRGIMQELRDGDRMKAIAERELTRDGRELLERISDLSTPGIWRLSRGFRLCNPAFSKASMKEVGSWEVEHLETLEKIRRDVHAPAVDWETRI